MSSIVKLKRSVTPDSVPAVGSLVEGEVAMNIVDGRMYVRDNAAAVVEVGLRPLGTFLSDDVDIGGGVIDDTIIGGTVPAAVTTTSLIATTADINGGTLDGVTIGASTPGSATFTLVDLAVGSAAAPTLTFGEADSGIYAGSTNVDDIRVSSGGNYIGGYEADSATWWFGFEASVARDFDDFVTVDSRLAVSANGDIPQISIDQQSNALLTENSSLGKLIWRGHDDNPINHLEGARIQCLTAEDWTFGLSGTKMNFDVQLTLGGGYYTALTIDGDGILNAHNNMYIEGDARISDDVWNQGAIMLDGAERFVSLTQAAYDLLTPDANTIYFVVG